MPERVIEKGAQNKKVQSKNRKIKLVKRPNRSKEDNDGRLSTVKLNQTRRKNRTKGYQDDRNPLKKVGKQISILGAKKLGNVDPPHVRTHPVDSQQELNLQPLNQSLSKKSPFITPELKVSENLQGVSSVLLPANAGSIVDANLKWVDSEFTRSISENSHYRVIAVVGAQGTGKSKFLNKFSLSLKGENEDLYFDRNLDAECFQVQDSNNWERLMHQTTGINGSFFSSGSQRFLLLDTQPLLSPSVCCSLMSEKHCLPDGFESVMELVSMQSLQILVFVLTVAHSIVLIPETSEDSAGVASVDCTLWRLVRLALVAKHRNIAETDEIDHCADILLQSQDEETNKLWCNYFADLMHRKDQSSRTSNQFRPRVSTIAGAQDRKLLEFLHETFEFEKLYTGNTIDLGSDCLSCNISGNRMQVTEKEWFVFSKKVWTEFTDSKIYKSFKDILKKSEVGIF
mmetsp:Transcript_8706/g.10427  ORF Transcript_8706/g.10427 Transcript_8706/m.10427 type:complete len:456 (+) Transcript_8706:83-1450(+)